MKRLTAIIILTAMVLTLAACGSKAPAETKAPEGPVDLAALYEKLTAKMAPMVQLDETMMLNFYGIAAADCQQAVVAICEDGMKADEVWLLQAKDADAEKNLAELADLRLKSKADETESYAPDQYAVVQKAELIQRGGYIVMLVSPDVAELKTIVDSAIR